MTNKMNVYCSHCNQMIVMNMTKEEIILLRINDPFLFDSCNVCKKQICPNCSHFYDYIEDERICQIFCSNCDPFSYSSEDFISFIDFVDILIAEKMKLKMKKYQNS